MFMNLSRKLFTRWLSDIFPELTAADLFAPSRPSCRRLSSSWSFWAVWEVLIGSWRFCTSLRGRDPSMWSKELHLHSRGWSLGGDPTWGQSSTEGNLPLFTLSDCVLVSDRALWRSEKLLYLCEQPLHIFVGRSSIPFGTVRLRVTFEREGSVYLERSSCTSGQWKVSDCELCRQLTVLCELAPQLGLWTGLGEHTSLMTTWLQLFKGNLRLGLPAYIQKNIQRMLSVVNTWVQVVL